MDSTNIAKIPSPLGIRNARWEIKLNLSYVFVAIAVIAAVYMISSRRPCKMPKKTKEE